MAEITIEDAKEVMIPKITDDKTRDVLQPFVDNLMSSRSSLRLTVSTLLNDERLRIPMPEKCLNHTALV